MVKITFVDQDGTQYPVDADPGVNLMETAVRNGIAAIEGECGGVCACATCHIYVPEEWRSLTGSVGEDEHEMLELAIDPDDRSRLGCQILVSMEMDGMTIFTPRCQR